jgi:hypothetical protein
VPEYPVYTDWGENVVDFWKCVPHPEREAAIAMADTAIALAPFTVKSLVEAAFYLGGAEANETRWLVWQANWSVTTETVEVDEVEVEVLLVDQEWMFTLAQAFEDGVIIRRPSERCRQLAFVNAP